MIICLSEQETQTEGNFPSDSLENILEDPLKPNSIPGMRKLLANLTKEKGELTNKLDFYYKRTDFLNGKIIELEKKVKISGENKEKLNENLSEMELILLRKKNKVKYYKKENIDLLEKLGLYVDKDQINRLILRNKEGDNEKKDIEAEEKEKELYENIKGQNEEIKGLYEKITYLESENTKLQDILAAEQETLKETIENNEEIKRKMIKKNSFLQLKTEENKPNLKKMRRSCINVDYEPNKITIQPVNEPKIPKNLEKWLIKLNNYENKGFLDKNLDFLLENQELDLKIEALKQKNLLKTLEETQEQSESLNKQLKTLQKKLLETPPIINKPPINNNFINKTPPNINNINKNNSNINKNPQNINNIKKNTSNINKTPQNINKTLTKFSQKPQTSEVFMRESLQIPNKSQKTIEKEAIKSLTPDKTPQNHLIKPSHLRVRTETEPFSDPRPCLWSKTQPKSKVFLENLTTKTPRDKEFDCYQVPFYEDLLENTKENGYFEEDSNFARKKFLYKYPFRNIDQENWGDFSGKSNTNEEFFTKIYRDLREKHRACGEDCGHLQRFYQKIRFIGRSLKKDQLNLQKNLIDKLPINF